MLNAIGTSELNNFTLSDELLCAGLDGVLASFGGDGQYTWREGATDEQKAAVEALVAQHDPNASSAPTVISDRQFAQQAALQGLVSDDEALAWVGNGTIPAELMGLLAKLPADQQFGAKMMLTGATTFDRRNPMTIALTTAFGWDAKTRNAFWTAAFAL